MKKILKLTFAFLLICSIWVNPLIVNAEEDNSDFEEVSADQINVLASSRGNLATFSEPSLDMCDLGIGISSNGIGVSYTTRATTTATEIGVKNMVLQEKTLLGWKDIVIRDHYNYDTDYYAGSVVYLKAEVGKTYRVYCTHYAIIDDVEYTLYNITDSIVYN